MRVDYFIRLYACENPVFKTSIFRDLEQILKIPTRKLKKNPCSITIFQFQSTKCNNEWHGTRRTVCYFLAPFVDMLSILRILIGREHKR